MSHKSDVNLGIELATVYDAGHHILPAVKTDYDAAWAATPASASYLTSRPAGIGDDPGALFDQMLDRLNKMTSDTSITLDGVAKALIYAANQLAEADATVKTEFDTKRKALGEVPLS